MADLSRVASSPPSDLVLFHSIGHDETKGSEMSSSRGIAVPKLRNFRRSRRLMMAFYLLLFGGFRLDQLSK